MDPKEQEAIENDELIKKLSKSKAREATTLLRNISSCLIDPNLLASQAFCLFLYGSCGAVVPYLPLYFKQFGLKPYQVGVILGIAPIVQCLLSPIWSVIANKWHVQKLVFLSGVLSFVVKLLLILAVQPRKQYCLESFVNSTTNLTYVRSIALTEALKNKPMSKWKKMRLNPPTTRLPTKTTVKPTTPADIKNPDMKNNSSRYNSSYRFDDLIHENNMDASFRLTNRGSQELLAHRSKVTEKRHDFHLFSQPLEASIKNDDVKLLKVASQQSRKVLKKSQHFNTLLRENVQHAIIVDQYELNDLFLIFVMFVLVCDFLQSPTFALGNGSVLRRVNDSYQVNPSKMRLTGTFGWIAAVLVVGVILSKSKWALCGSTRFSYEVAFYFSIGLVCMAFVNALWFEYIYDQNDDNTIETWRNSLKTFFDRKGITFFVGLMYISLCSGFLAPFLNWYIDDLQGSTLTIAAVCAARECMVLVFYILGNTLALILGRINIMLFSLTCYSVCFFCYWLLQNLWVAVGVVVVEGAAFGLLWRSCEKCIRHLKVPTEAANITKGFLDAMFWGIGNGGGALIGGAVYGWIGGRDTFLTFGIVTIVMLLVVTIIQLCISKKDDDEEEQGVLNQISGDEVSEDGEY